jgi:protein-disulfide isomerase
VVKGPAEAPIDVQWYSDLRSPLTPKAAQLMNELLAKYPDQIRLTVRHRPVDLRPDGKLAHEGALAAAAQGKFWEMHDLITASGKAVTRESLAAFAAKLELDVARFNEELEAGTHKATVARDIADAERRAVRGTPVFFVQGQRVDGIQPISLFDRIISAELAKPKATVPK